MIDKKIFGMFAALSLVITAHTATAQERTNPFIAPPTEAEEQARQDERMRTIVWELQPELKSLIMQDVAAAQASLEIKMRRRIDLAVKEVSTDIARQIPVVSPSAGGEETDPNTPVASNIPENSKFISCVNGKALYRDSNNTLFQVAENGNGIKHCSN